MSRCLLFNVFPLALIQTSVGVGIEMCSTTLIKLVPVTCRSAHMLSRYRPRAPIIAVTRSGQTARQAHLYRGIYPVLYTKPANDVWAEDVDLRVNFALEAGECWVFRLAV